MTTDHPTRQKVYAFIVAYKAAHDGNSPTIQEIARGANLSKSGSVIFHLKKLESLGLIKCSNSISRGIQVVGGKWIAPEPIESHRFGQPNRSLNRQCGLPITRQTLEQMMDKYPHLPALAEALETSTDTLNQWLREYDL